MARLQLLFPLAFWAIWLGHHTDSLVSPMLGAPIYLMSLALIVLLMRGFARHAMDYTMQNAGKAAHRFHHVMFIARWAILLMHLLALMALGWGDVILATGLTWHGKLEAPGALLSASPVVIAWIGLFWAQYPLDRALREQNALNLIEAGDQAFDAPTLRQHILNNTRVQVFTLLAPVGMAILLRDGLMMIFAHTRMGRTVEAETAATLLSALVVFLIGPEILRRVLPVQRLPDSPLRTRLEATCERLGLRYRDILLWRTHFSFCNAAVMGLFPRVRYILLSDLLLETMQERQVEAVFAHEAGHVVHRHMTWYLVFAVVFFLWLGAANELLFQFFGQQSYYATLPMDSLVFGLGIAAFFIIFGSLSRSFERQADLFAARSLTGGQEDTPVEQDGVETFNSALEHVARMNNMPLDAKQFATGRGWLRHTWALIIHHTATWLHGSIRSRMDYLRTLPAHPDLTERFDRRMFAIRVALLVALCGTTAWAITSSIVH